MDSRRHRPAFGRARRKLDEHEGCRRTRPASEVEGFTASDVVLEVWGTFDGDEAIVVQAVVPLLSREAQGWPATEHFFEDSFTYDSQESELRFLKRLVRDSVQMRNTARLAALER